MTVSEWNVPTNSGPFTTFASRLNSFRRGGTMSPIDALALLATVPGITATELNYPQHFGEPASQSPIAAARALGLEVTALNLRFDPPTFARGAFTHPESAVRRQAVATAVEAVDVASAEGINHVILWLGPDGFEYPLQVDYRWLWEWMVDGIRDVASRGPNVRVSIEYKPAEPRRVSLIRTMSDALLAARDTGAANVGVTLDFCHALMCGESPAMAAALAAREGRLVGIHLNDGYGPADDGMAVGSVHPWHTLELLYVLRQVEWNGTIYFDTFPENVDPVRECAANIAMVRALEAMLARLDMWEVSRIQEAQDGIGAAQLLNRLLVS